MTLKAINPEAIPAKTRESKSKFSTSSWPRQSTC